mmetsp:Transcript_35971/g.113039  ORF Transcript_35971/g.113039 Transcript_35971/m.113039 type:complete len:284 (+) Transcript_35971:247-1098(+)
MDNFIGATDSTEFCTSRPGSFAAWLAAYICKISFVRCSMMPRYCIMLLSVTPWLPSISSTEVDAQPMRLKMLWMPCLSWLMVFMAAWYVSSCSLAFSSVFLRRSSRLRRFFLRSRSLLMPCPLKRSISALVSLIMSSRRSISLFCSFTKLKSEKFFSSASRNFCTTSSTSVDPTALAIFLKASSYDATVVSVSCRCGARVSLMKDSDPSVVLIISSSWCIVSSASSLASSFASAFCARMFSLILRSCSMRRPSSAHSRWNSCRSPSACDLSAAISWNARLRAS